MSLLAQILSLCTVSMGLGVAWLLVQGEPAIQPAGGEQAVCTATPPTLELGTPWIGQEEAHELFGDPGVLFIDCRPQSEFVTGHIASALSLPSDHPDIGPELEAVLRPARTIIAYCDAVGGCQSSARLAARLRELGMQDVRILSDGLPGWIERGYPAESGTCRLCPKESL
jgi:rhodanese-related sulfurtransferase